MTKEEIAKLSNLPISELHRACRDMGIFLAALNLWKDFGINIGIERTNRIRNQAFRDYEIRN